MVSIADSIFFNSWNEPFENPVGPSSNDCRTVAIESFSFCDQNHLSPQKIERLSLLG